MSLQQRRSDYGPPAIPLQPTSSTEEKNGEGHTKTWNLANKLAKHLEAIMKFTNSTDFDKI